MLFPKLRNSDPVLGWIDNDESWDTYLNEEPPRTEPAECPICGNLYFHKEWHQPEEVQVEHEDRAKYVCPGCQQKLDGYFRGVLTVQGGFLVDHHEEISNLIMNEIRERQTKNPIHKVVRVDVEDHTAVIKVTRGKLAERLGRKLLKAYGGELEVQQSDRITRVNWDRDRQAET